MASERHRLTAKGRPKHILEFNVSTAIMLPSGCVAENIVKAQLMGSSLERALCATVTCRTDTLSTSSGASGGRWASVGKYDGVYPANIVFNALLMFLNLKDGRGRVLDERRGQCNECSTGRR